MLRTVSHAVVVVCVFVFRANFAAGTAADHLDDSTRFDKDEILLETGKPSRNANPPITVNTLKMDYDGSAQNANAEGGGRSAKEKHNGRIVNRGVIKAAFAAGGDGGVAAALPHGKVGEEVFSLGLTPPSDEYHAPDEVHIISNEAWASARKNARVRRKESYAKVDDEMPTPAPALVLQKSGTKGGANEPKRGFGFVEPQQGKATLPTKGGPGLLPEGSTASFGRRFKGGEMKQEGEAASRDEAEEGEGEGEGEEAEAEASVGVIAGAAGAGHGHGKQSKAAKPAKSAKSGKVTKRSERAGEVNRAITGRSQGGPFGVTGKMPVYIMASFIASFIIAIMFIHRGEGANRIADVVGEAAPMNVGTTRDIWSIADSPTRSSTLKSKRSKWSILSLFGDGGGAGAGSSSSNAPGTPGSRIEYGSLRENPSPHSPSQVSRAAVMTPRKGRHSPTSSPYSPSQYRGSAVLSPRRAARAAVHTPRKSNSVCILDEGLDDIDLSNNYDAAASTGTSPSRTRVVRVHGYAADGADTYMLEC